MTCNQQNGAIILIGYEWRQAVEVTPGDLFPSGGTWQAQVRASRSSSDVLATMTTGDGGIVRVADNEIELILTAEQTALMSVGTVIMDVVRTDVDPAEHLGFSLTIPVRLPVTRP